MSEGPVRLRGVEAARGVAALLVVTVHASHILSIPSQSDRLAFGGFWTFGRAGVDFFFVLSGFIIAYIHAKDVNRPDQVRPYWRKRLWRIYPTYWVVLTAFMALLLLSPTRDLAERDPFHLLCSYLLLPEVAAPILEVGWSLRHELLFYGLFSLLLLRKGLGQAVLAAWLVGIVWNLSYRMATGTPYFGGIADTVVFRVFNIQFFFGMAVAVLVPRSAWRPGLMLSLGAGLFFLNGMMESFGPHVPNEWPPRHIAYAVGAAMSLYGLAVLDRTGRGRVPGWLVALGAASYSIYLVHVPVALVLGFLLRPVRLVMPMEIQFAAVVVTAAITGLILSLLVEQPLLRMGRTRRAAVQAA